MNTIYHETYFGSKPTLIICQDNIRGVCHFWHYSVTDPVVLGYPSTVAVWKIKWKYDDASVLNWFSNKLKPFLKQQS